MHKWIWARVVPSSRERSSTETRLWMRLCHMSRNVNVGAELSFTNYTVRCLQGWKGSALSLCSSEWQAGPFSVVTQRNYVLGLIIIILPATIARGQKVLTPYRDAFGVCVCVRFSVCVCSSIPAWSCLFLCVVLTASTNKNLCGNTHERVHLYLVKLE